MPFLILLFFILATLLFLLKDPHQIRESILKAFISVFLLILLTTEILSLVNKITYEWIILSWIITISAVICTLILVWVKKKDRLKELLSSLSKNFELEPRVLIVVCLTSILIVLGITLTIALKSPPNNFAKAKAQTFLAAMPNIVCSVGVAAQKQYWDFDSEVLTEIKLFL